MLFYNNIMSHMSAIVSNHYEQLYRSNIKKISPETTMKQA